MGWLFKRDGFRLENIPSDYWKSRREFWDLGFGKRLLKVKENKGSERNLYRREWGSYFRCLCNINAGRTKKYLTEILLRLPEEAYDNMVHNLLGDDRLFAGLPKGARSRLYKILNARDMSSVIEVFKSALPFNKRRRLETRRQNMKARILRGV